MVCIFRERCLITSSSTSTTFRLTLKEQSKSFYCMSFVYLATLLCTIQVWCDGPVVLGPVGSNLTGFDCCVLFSSCLAAPAACSGVSSAPDALELLGY